MASLKGRSLQIRIKKALALLCYLAVEGGRHPRSELAELLWPGSDERRARVDLRAVLSRLRKSLGEDSADDEEASRFIVVEANLLRVELIEVEPDLEALEAAVSLARSKTSLQVKSAEDDAVGRRELIGRLQGALELYRGEFMEGFSLEDAPEFELICTSTSTGLRRVRCCNRAATGAGHIRTEQENYGARNRRKPLK